MLGVRVVTRGALDVWSLMFDRCANGLLVEMNSWEELKGKGKHVER